METQAGQRRGPSALAYDALRRRLRELAGNERAIQVDFLLHLAEFDGRRGFAEAGHDSLWTYCLRELHLREGPAARRIGAMRVLRDHPRLEAPLRDGRLCLSTVTIIGRLVGEFTLDDLVARAAYKTKAEVEQLHAELRPSAASRDGVRQITAGAGAIARMASTLPRSCVAPGLFGPASIPSPADTSVASANTPALAHRSHDVSGSHERCSSHPDPRSDRECSSQREIGSHQECGSPRAVSSHEGGGGDDVARLGGPGRAHAVTDSAGSSSQVTTSVEAAGRTHASSGSAATAAPIAERTERSRAELTPVAAEKWSLRVTMDAEMKANLDTLKSLLSHKAGGDLAAVLREALRCAVETHGKRCGAVTPKLVRRTQAAPATRPAPSTARTPESPAIDSRNIPASVRREVWARDGGCCAWKAKDGTRCGSRWKLEYDHVVPVALGGASTVNNVRVLCRAHNVLHAEHVFGRSHMQRFRKAGQHRTPPDIRVEDRRRGAVPTRDIREEDRRRPERDNVRGNSAASALSPGSAGSLLSPAATVPGLPGSATSRLSTGSPTSRLSTGSPTSRPSTGLPTSRLSTGSAASGVSPGSVQARDKTTPRGDRPTAANEQPLQLDAFETG